eukprot:CAMPEP_0116902338 /NCGR_PEP_ID=MMETSP0467-20121206/9962_1 /TAXON_ID=283647 /ORGANISM="Mesodinium pulex, Strain SPMC105" /LENGTH=116 /DNA_ID=CAMNT_0004576169 /DNA_START=946 /DNA_END=1296 /DNA_ORIENTATION=-
MSKKKMIKRAIGRVSHEENESGSCSNSPDKNMSISFSNSNIIQKPNMVELNNGVCKAISEEVDHMLSAQNYSTIVRHVEIQQNKTFIKFYDSDGNIHLHEFFHEYNQCNVGNNDVM